jgi:hypothetical protein
MYGFMAKLYVSRLSICQILLRLEKEIRINNSTMDEILSKWTFLALHLCMMTQEKRDKQGGIKFSSFQMKA